MRFQNKINDRDQIDQLMSSMTVSDESSYLWCHHDGRLIIYDAHLSTWDRDKRFLVFKLNKNTSRLPLSSLTQLNVFHESLLMIFKSPIENYGDELLKLKAPESVLKLAQAEDFLPELLASQNAPSDVDKSDLELISQVLEVINTNTSQEAKEAVSAPSTSYVFSKKDEIKESTGTFAFSNKGVVEDSVSGTIKEKTAGNKKMRVAISRPGAEAAVYPLSDVETHSIAFQTLVKGEFKVGDEIIVHSIYDSPLSNPLSAKIVVFDRPSEYAKYFRVEAKFSVATEIPEPKNKKAKIERVGIKRILAEDTYSHESLYQLSDMNTNGLIMIEKKKGEFNIDDKIIISNLFGNSLKSPLQARIKSFQETSEERLITLEFIKPED